MRIEQSHAVALTLSGAVLLGSCGDEPVTPSLPVASVALNLSLDTLEYGTTRQLSVDIRDANNAPLAGRPVTWDVIDPGVVMVNGAGLVTGVDNGIGRVTATVEGLADTARFVVWVGVTGSWDGSVTAFNCDFDAGLEEATDGTIIGTGYRDAPCGVDRFAIVGVHGVGGVVDSVEMTWTGTGSTLNLAATFDGVDLLTGAVVSGGGCTPATCQFTMESYLKIAR
jgi:hypothetical protein